MCFGDAKQSSTETSQSLPGWLTEAAKGNLDYAGSLQQQGFTPYSGQQVANFSPQQQGSFDLGGQIAGGVAPFVGQTGSLISNYANAGPQHVTPDTIASQMSPYMNQYVNLALQPQLQMQDAQFAQQNKGVDSAATMAGAFGDTGWGLLRGQTTQAQDAARAGLIGNAYNTAFNTAIGAGAQDVANRMNAGTTNANLAETALGRQLTGANALNATGTGATNLTNTLGGQQTAQSQADLNARYNQWVLSQQYPFQTTQLMNSSIGAARAGSPVNTMSTTTAPDNSGWGMLGSLAGVVAAPFTGGLSLLPGMMAGAMGGMGGGKADGGVPPVGEPSLVGERGPELFVPNTTGVIVPNEVLQAARLLRAAKTAPTTMKFGIAA